MNFLHDVTQVAGPMGYLTGLSDLLVRSQGQSALVYSVSAKNGGVLVMDMSNGLRILDQAAFPSRAVALDAPRQLAETVLNGTPVLISYGHYGATLDVFPLDAQGLIGTPYTLNMPANSGKAVAITGAEIMDVGARSFFVFASRQDSGLSVWEADSQNILRPIKQSAAAGIVPANDILALAQATVGGGQQILALSSGGEKLLSYRMQANGELTVLSQLDARDGLAIGTGSALAVVEVAGRSFALVGAAGSGSLAVVALEAGGRMVVTDHVMDDRDTRFAGLTELATLTHDGQVYIAAAGSDDGISLLTLLPDGRLVHLTTIVDDNSMALTNVSGLALLGRNGRIDLVASGGAPTSDDGSGITLLHSLTGPVGTVLMARATGQMLIGGAGRDQILGGAGNDRLEGRAGDDILVDGAGTDTLIGGLGADVFVFRPDGQSDFIFDFERGIDRLDLADLGRFYTMDALQFIERSNGADIRIGNEQVSIRTSDGQTLRKTDLLIGDLRDLAHLDIAPLSQPGVSLSGTVAADYIDGRAGADWIIGLGGGDTLLGGGGDDTILGGDENASFDLATGQVYRLYRATLGREADLAGLLAWAGQLTGEARSLTQVAAGFVGSPEFRSHYGGLDNRAFVSLLYTNVLGRAADTAGLNAWADLLNNGARSREQVVIGFSESAEFKQQTEMQTLLQSHEALELGVVDDVFRLYQAVLDRPPDRAGFLGWVDRLAEGSPLSGVISGFVHSAEFQATYGTANDREFVTLLYANVLGRLPDAAGLNAWVRQLQTGASRHEDVVLGFVQSKEFIAATATALRNWIISQGYDDLLNGGAGNNLLFGGMWADTFQFHAADPSTNHILGFEPWDRLSFQGFGYATAGEVGAHLQQDGTTTVFHDQDMTIMFEHTNMADILAATFLF